MFIIESNNGKRNLYYRTEATINRLKDTWTEDYDKADQYPTATLAAYTVLRLENQILAGLTPAMNELKYVVI